MYRITLLFNGCPLCHVCERCAYEQELVADLTLKQSAAASGSNSSGCELPTLIDSSQKPHMLTLDLSSQQSATAAPNSTGTTTADADTSNQPAQL